MENPIKMDDLGVPLSLETPILCAKSKANTPNLAYKLTNHTLTWTQTNLPSEKKHHLVQAVHQV